MRMMLIPAAAPPGPPGVGKHLAAAAVAAPRAQAAPEAAPATDAPTAPPQFIIERGVRCVGGQAFYRPESAQGRDLAMLAARLHKRQRGALRVLDLMAGSGVRGARYLLHAEADEVWCNDFNPSLRRQLVYNLCSNAARAADSHSSSESPPQVEDPSTEQQLEEAVQQWEQQATAHALPGLRFPIHEWTPTSRQAPGTSAPSLSPSPLSSSLVEVDAASSASPQPPCSGECSSAGAEARNGSPGPAPVAASDVQAAAGSHQHPHQPPPPQQQQCARPGAARVRWSSMDAKRLLAGVWLREDYPDLLDIDSFGSDSSFLGNAVDTVSYQGGLLYLTATDGFSSGGRRPLRALAAFNCYTRALPCANEQGLRMLIGAAVKEGAARGVALTPVFSLFSFHGPVFRCMLRARRSAAEWPAHHLGFLGHCHVHGVPRAVHWRELGHATCTCLGHGEARGGGTPLAVAGPMWTGPLHNAEDIRAMADEAKALRWTGHSAEGAAPQRSKKNGPRRLEQLLEIMLEEADERLPPGYVTLDALGALLQSSPPRDALLAALRHDGHAAARCHVDAKAIRTSASLQQVLDAAERLGIRRRAAAGPAVG